MASLAWLNMASFRGDFHVECFMICHLFRAWFLNSIVAMVPIYLFYLITHLTAIRVHDKKLVCMTPGCHIKLYSVNDSAESDSVVSMILWSQIRGCHWYCGDSKGTKYVYIKKKLAEQHLKNIYLNIKCLSPLFQGTKRVLIMKREKIRKLVLFSVAEQVEQKLF